MNNILFRKVSQIEGGIVLDNPNVYLEGAEIAERFAKFSSLILILGLLLPFFATIFAIYVVATVILSLLRLGVLLSPVNYLILWFPNIIKREDAKQVPVRFFRVRDESGRECEVKIKGEIVQGDIRRGDVVSITGRWQGGTLIFYRGFNHRINSAIRVKRSHWSRTLAVIILIYIITSIACYIGVR